jgi:hypothetical protein
MCVFPCASSQIPRGLGELKQNFPALVSRSKRKSKAVDYHIGSKPCVTRVEPKSRSVEALASAGPIYTKISVQNEIYAPVALTIWRRSLSIVSANNPFAIWKKEYLAYWKGNIRPV